MKNKHDIVYDDAFGHPGVDTCRKCDSNSMRPDWYGECCGIMDIPEECKIPIDLPRIEKTDYPSKSPKWDDKIERIQIVRYLDEIPLNYRSERDHEILKEFIIRAQRHFAELDPNFEPVNE